MVMRWNVPDTGVNHDFDFHGDQIYESAQEEDWSSVVIAFNESGDKAWLCRISEGPPQDAAFAGLNAALLRETWGTDIGVQRSPHLLRMSRKPESMQEPDFGSARESKATLELLRDPRVWVCPSCGRLSKPMSKLVAVSSALALILTVPVIVVLGTLFFGADTMRGNSTFLAIGFVVSIGLAWQTAKAGWTHTCQSCEKAALVPLSEEQRAERIAQIEGGPHSRQTP